MPRGIRLTDAKRDEVVASLDAGKTPHDVARETGVSLPTVRRIQNGPPSPASTAEPGARRRRRTPGLTNRDLLTTASELVALYQVDAIEDASDTGGEVKLRLTPKGERWLNLLQGVQSGGG